MSGRLTAVQLADEAMAQTNLMLAVEAPEAVLDPDQALAFGAGAWFGIASLFTVLIEHDLLRPPGEAS